MAIDGSGKGNIFAEDFTAFPAAEAQSCFDAMLKACLFHRLPAMLIDRVAALMIGLTPKVPHNPFC
ncbi:MAG TPA: hypothetical protein VGN88_06210 [Phycisphaerae bacterium]